MIISTHFYCVIGYPVEHSLSPRIHNQWFKKFRIPARCEAISVKPADLAKFMKTFRAKFSGANVTIPHKERIIKFLDSLSPEARAIGAVNCIVNRGGKLVGYNTDAYGAMEALRKVKRQKAKGKSDTQCHPREGGDLVKFLKGKKVIVLGAGGAARAVVYGLKKAGAEVTILNRTLSRAKKLAKEFKCDYMSLRAQPAAERAQRLPVEALAKAGSNLAFDILINTTSVGMWRKNGKWKMENGKCAWKMSNVMLSLSKHEKKPLVMDIVYTPRMTKLLRDAKHAGCKIITGDKMFLAQAAKSFELWTGTRPKFVKL